MGLDVYAGTLTRYYAKNWKTAVQRASENAGVEFQIIRANEDTSQPQDVIPVDEIQGLMRHWIETVSQVLQNNGAKRQTDDPYETWEDNNETEYYTDKPDWVAFGALLLFGACLFYGLPVPKQVKKDWNYWEDPISKRAFEDEKFNWSLFSDAEWWLPFNEPSVFECQTPNGVSIIMGTTRILLAELCLINELSWKADDATILEWSRTEGYPIDAELVDGEYLITGLHEEYDVESMAKLAFSILYQAALFSKEHRVPIILDY